MWGQRCEATQTWKLIASKCSCKTNKKFKRHCLDNLHDILHKSWFVLSHFASWATVARRRRKQTRVALGSWHKSWQAPHSLSEPPKWQNGQQLGHKNMLVGAGALSFSPHTTGQLSSVLGSPPVNKHQFSCHVASQTCVSCCSMQDRSCRIEARFRVLCCNVLSWLRVSVMPKADVPNWWKRSSHKHGNTLDSPTCDVRTAFSMTTKTLKKSCLSLHDPSPLREEEEDLWHQSDEEKGNKRSSQRSMSVSQSGTLDQHGWNKTNVAASPTLNLGFKLHVHSQSRLPKWQHSISMLQNFQTTMCLQQSNVKITHQPTTNRLLKLFTEKQKRQNKKAPALALEALPATDNNNHTTLLELWSWTNKDKPLSTLSSWQIQKISSATWRQTAWTWQSRSQRMQQQVSSKQETAKTIENHKDLVGAPNDTTNSIRMTSMMSNCCKWAAWHLAWAKNGREFWRSKAAETKEPSEHALHCKVALTGATCNEQSSVKQNICHETTECNLPKCCSNTTKKTLIKKETSLSRWQGQPPTGCPNCQRHVAWDSKESHATMNQTAWQKQQWKIVISKTCLRNNEELPTNQWQPWQMLNISAHQGHQHQWGKLSSLFPRTSTKKTNQCQTLLECSQRRLLSPTKTMSTMTTETLKTMVNHRQAWIAWRFSRNMDPGQREITLQKIKHSDSSRDDDMELLETNFPGMTCWSEEWSSGT